MSTISLTFYLRTENELAYNGRLLRETSYNFISQDFAISNYVVFLKKKKQVEISVSVL